MELFKLYHYRALHWFDAALLTPYLGRLAHNLNLSGNVVAIHGSLSVSKCVFEVLGLHGGKVRIVTRTQFLTFEKDSFRYRWGFVVVSVGAHTNDRHGVCGG